MNRRGFLGTCSLAWAAPPAAQGPQPRPAIDFRYAPLSWQTAFCFPDDPHKSLAGERGELRFGHPGQGKPIDYFPVVVEFSLAGMEPDRVAWQRLEAPGIPIIHTGIERPEALAELIAFATNEPDEGRADNVLLEVRPRSRPELRVRPLVRLRTRERFFLATEGRWSHVRLGSEDAPVFMTSSAPLSMRDTGAGVTLTAAEGLATPSQPLRVLFRFPLARRGLGGIRPEFTNTLWALAGLRAVAEAAERLEMGELAEARTFYEELRRAFFDAARQEMRRHPAGFEYLPMLMREDPQWSEPDEWRQPRPQVAQWALSHAIYPGLLFDRNDPIVSGHFALMQACTREDVPIETGWLPHEGLWVYNAAFVAHAYLWAGLTDWARRTFHGFLNHASPLYCWREEQPLRGSLVAGYVGDMPHNWASAECILFLRHLLALEDGTSLRLLAGAGDFELAAAEPYALAATPTRFGPVDLKLEPNGAGWRLQYRRGDGPSPARLELPVRLGSQLRFSAIEGAKAVEAGTKLLVDPEARRFAVTWK